MVVCFCDAGSADGAVFAARRLCEVACGAGLVGVVDRVVVGIEGQIVGVGFGGDEGGGGGRAETGEEVGQGNKEEDEEVIFEGEMGPGGREKQGRGGGEEG